MLLPCATGLSPSGEKKSKRNRRICGGFLLYIVRKVQHCTKGSPVYGELSAKLTEGLLGCSDEL